VGHQEVRPRHRAWHAGRAGSAHNVPVPGRTSTTGRRWARPGIEWIVLTKTRTSDPSRLVAATRSSASVEGVSTGYAAGATIQDVMSAVGSAIARTRAMSPAARTSGAGASGTCFSLGMPAPRSARGDEVGQSRHRNEALSRSPGGGAWLSAVGRGDLPTVEARTGSRPRAQAGRPARPPMHPGPDRRRDATYGVSPAVLRTAGIGVDAGTCAASWRRRAVSLDGATGRPMKNPCA